LVWHGRHISDKRSSICKGWKFIVRPVRSLGIWHICYTNGQQQTLDERTAAEGIVTITPPQKNNFHNKPSATAAFESIFEGSFSKRFYFLFCLITTFYFSLYIQIHVNETS